MEIILDALWDTLKVFPFLFLIYVLIEILEHRTHLTQNQKNITGKPCSAHRLGYGAYSAMRFFRYGG